MTPRADAMTALRTRLLTVAGVGTTWPVLSANRKTQDEPLANATFLEDVPAGDSTIASAMNGASGHDRMTTGAWQINIVFPPDTGIAAATAMADAIEAAFVSTPITLPGGEYVRIMEVLAQPPRYPDDDPRVRIPLVISYQFIVST